MNMGTLQSNQKKIKLDHRANKRNKIIPHMKMTYLSLLVVEDNYR